MKADTRLQDIVVAAIVGAVTSLAMSLVISYVTNICIMPLRDKQQRKFQITEQRLSNLYQPIMIATANGNFSITSDIPFWKVYRIMEQHGYLAEEKVMNKYIEFLEVCRFASLSDIFSKAYADPKIPSEILREVIKTRPENPPLAWTASTLPEALKKEKEFIRAFKEDYQEALREFDASLK